MSVYGVGVANRYAALMDDDENVTSTSQAKGGKENKDNTTKGKIAPGKAHAAATGAPSNKQQQPQASTKSASAANNIGNKAAPGSKQQQQQHVKNVGKGGKADVVNNNSIHAVNNNQVSQGKSPRNQPTASANDAAKAAGQASEEQRQPRLDHRGQARDRPRQDRPPRQQATDSHGNGPQKDSDEARKNRRNREDRGPLQPSNFTGEANAEGSGEGRTNRGPRNPKFFKGDRPPRAGGARGPRSFGSDNRDGRGKPVFDRHSGSDKAGIKPVEKRDGAGAHNWGTYTDELEGQVAPEETRPEKTAADESNDQGETHADEVEPAKEAEEEGPKEMTLEEYRKQHGGKRHQPKFKLRKPGEGEDNAQWKEYSLLKKDDEQEELDVDSDGSDGVLKEEPEGRHNKKKVIDIDIRFTNTSFRGGDDRGRRGGGRPGGRAGGPERKRTQANGSGFTNRKQTAPKVDDINDFPSLGVAA